MYFLLLLADFVVVYKHHLCWAISYDVRIQADPKSFDERQRFRRQTDSKHRTKVRNLTLGDAHIASGLFGD